MAFEGMPKYSLPGTHRKGEKALCVAVLCFDISREPRAFLSTVSLLHFSSRGYKIVAETLWLEGSSRNSAVSCSLGAAQSGGIPRVHRGDVETELHEAGGTCLWMLMTSYNASWCR